MQAPISDAATQELLHLLQQHDQQSHQHQSPPPAMLSQSISNDQLAYLHNLHHAPSNLTADSRSQSYVPQGHNNHARHAPAADRHRHYSVIDTNHAQRSHPYGGTRESHLRVATHVERRESYGSGGVISPRSDAQSEGSSTMKSPKKLRGYSCHQCKSTKRQDLLLFCSKGISDKKKRKCRKKYCDSCLRRLYNQSVHTVEQKDMWQCPSCQYRCTCANCKRRDPSLAGSYSVGGEVGDSDEDSDGESGTPMSPMLHGLDKLPTQKRRASSHSHAHHRPSYTMLPASAGLPPLIALAADPHITTRNSTKRKDRESVHQSLPGTTSWSIPASTLNVDANTMFDDQQLQTLLANQRAVCQSYDAVAFAQVAAANNQQNAYDSSLLHQYISPPPQLHHLQPIPHGTPAREVPPPLVALQDTLSGNGNADLMSAMLAMSPIDTQHLLSAVQQSVQHTQRLQSYHSSSSQHSQPAIPLWPAVSANLATTTAPHHSSQLPLPLQALNMPASRATSAASFYQTEPHSVQASPADAAAQMINDSHLQAAMNKLMAQMQQQMQQQQQQQQYSHDEHQPAVNLAALIESVANQAPQPAAASWNGGMTQSTSVPNFSAASHGVTEQPLPNAMQPTSSPIASELYAQSQQLDVNVGDVVSPTAATGLMSLSLQHKDDGSFDPTSASNVHTLQNSNRFTFSGVPSRPTSATLTNNTNATAASMLQSSPSDKFLPGSSEAMFMFSPVGRERNNSLGMVNASPPNALPSFNGTPTSKLPAGMLNTGDLPSSTGFALPSLSRPMSMLTDLAGIDDFQFTG